MGSEKGASEIKSHPFFEGFSWENLLNKKVIKKIYKNFKIVPEFVPKLKSVKDLKYFEDEFLDESKILLNYSKLEPIILYFN